MVIYTLIFQHDTGFVTPCGSFHTPEQIIDAVSWEIDHAGENMIVTSDSSEYIYELSLGVVNVDYRFHRNADWKHGRYYLIPNSL